MCFNTNSEKPSCWVSTPSPITLKPTTPSPTSPSPTSNSLQIIHLCVLDYCFTRLSRQKVKKISGVNSSLHLHANNDHLKLILKHNDPRECDRRLRQLVCLTCNKCKCREWVPNPFSETQMSSANTSTWYHENHHWVIVCVTS